jgi:hypothetical protein
MRATQALGELADLDARSAGIIARILQPVLSLAIVLFIARIVLSWYPQVPSHAPLLHLSARSFTCMHASHAALHVPVAARAIGMRVGHKDINIFVHYSRGLACTACMHAC